MTELIDELNQIPQALIDLVDQYQIGDGQMLRSLPASRQPLLVGMGASYHAAWIGSLMLRNSAIPSLHEEAGEVIHYQSLLPSFYAPLIYISQSGSSGEVQPLIDLTTRKMDLVAITNNPNSPLAKQAGLVLPMVAGEETLISGKTYINTLALLWLISQEWAHGSLENAFDELRHTADRIAAIQAQRERIVERFETLFDKSGRVVFLGHGPHSATARQAAMTLSEWPKLSCLSFGIGAYRHGFIESTDASTGVVLFTPPGKTRASALQLGEELRSYGANVLRMENGQLLGLGDPVESISEDNVPVDEYLSPILDIVPVQLFAEAAARKRLEKPGFRYISKVVTKI